jgi:hypothetical protein
VSRALKIDEAAAELRVSRRWLEIWLANHPMDATGNPFYVPMGRSKTFEETDIARLSKAIGAIAKRATFVYFIEMHGHIKIGITDNWKKRFSAIRSSSPFPVVVLLVLRRKVGLEKELHDKFADHRVRGEWFLDHPEIRMFIKTRKQRCVAKPRASK